MRPTPIQPIVILLLGALAPSTEEETIVGKAKPVVANAVLFRKSRRDIKLLVVIFSSITVSPT